MFQEMSRTLAYGNVPQSTVKTRGINSNINLPLTFSLPMTAAKLSEANRRIPSHVVSCPQEMMLKIIVFNHGKIEVTNTTVLPFRKISGSIENPQYMDLVLQKYLDNAGLSDIAEFEKFFEESTFDKLCKPLLVTES